MLCSDLVFALQYQLSGMLVDVLVRTNFGTRPRSIGLDS
jgi:hypothetical protein